MIDRFIEQKQNAGYANATINRWLEAPPSIHSGAELFAPARVHLAEIEMLEEDNVREGFLEHDDYLRFRGELPDHQRLILVIGYHLGMRRGEILKLRWDQVDWKENLIRLERRQTKGKQARVAILWRTSSLVGNGVCSSPRELSIHNFMEG
jgi:integrase